MDTLTLNNGIDNKPHGNNGDDYPCDEGSNTTTYGSSRQTPTKTLDERLRL